MQYRRMRPPQPVPKYLSHESMVLNMVICELTLRKQGYTAEEIGRMPKDKVELFTMVARRFA